MALMSLLAVLVRSSESRIRVATNIKLGGTIKRRGRAAIRSPRSSVYAAIEIIALSSEVSFKSAPVAGRLELNPPLTSG